MIAPKVLTEDDVQQALRERGFVPTDATTATGRYWRHKFLQQHVLVPKSLDGFYPDWMLYDLMSRVGEIVPSVTASPMFPLASRGHPTRH